MKDLLTVLSFLFMTLVLMCMLIPSILLDLDDRREAKRKAQANPEA
jgi:hypothetical protein